MTKKITRKEKPKLTVHGLLGAISYWGTTARFMLVGVLIVFAFLLNLTGDSTSQYIDTEIIFLIFGLGTLLMLDLGYVVAARALTLNKVVDRWTVMLGDLALAAFFVVPSLVQIGTGGNKLRIIGLIAALFVLAIRILVGLLFAKRK